MKTRLIKEELAQVYKYRDRIDLEPDFQREKVWTLQKQQYFLDTLLKKWGVPKFYLYVSGEDSLGKMYQCIDGKQRLGAIFSFLDNEYSLNRKYSGVLGGKYYKDLSIAIRKKLDSYPIHYEEVSGDKNNEVGELFKRLQNGATLNSGENLMAIKSELKDKIKRLSQHQFFKAKISLKNKRYSHFTLCSQLFFLELEGMSDVTLRRLENMLLSNKNLSTGGFRLKTKLKKFKEVLDYLNKVFDKQSVYLKNRASVVTFYLLVSELMERTNLKSKERLLNRFYTNFSKELEREIAKGVNAQDAEYVNYQSNVTEGAYKQKRLKARRDIMLKKLYKFNPVFYKLMNPHRSPKEIFQDLYDRLEVKSGSSKKVDEWIFREYPRAKKIKHARGPEESTPSHIRHVLHHKKHGKFSAKQLKEAISFLQKLVAKATS